MKGADFRSIDMQKGKSSSDDGWMNMFRKYFLDYIELSKKYTIVEHSIGE